MIKWYILLAVLLLNPPNSFGQNPVVSYLSGIILDADNELPINNLTVSTKFTGDIKTNHLGRFNLPLAQCNCRPGDKIIIFTYNDEYGSSLNEYTISRSAEQDIIFRIFKNPNTIYLNGLVKDKNGHAPISEIEVKISTGNIPVNISDVTTKDGSFRLPIPKKYLGNEKTVRLIYTDRKNRYEQLDEEQRINSFAKVFLTSTNSGNIPNSEADYRKIIATLGMSWKYSDFMQTLKDHDTITAMLFINGGMKLNSADFPSYFYTYYSDTITNLFIQRKTVNASMCPIDGFDAPYFYENVSKEHNKAAYVRNICGTNQNIQTLTELIKTEEEKVKIFSKQANDIKRTSTCVKEILNKQPLNQDSLFYSLYNEAAKDPGIIFKPITYTERQAVLAKLVTFLLTNRKSTNTEGLKFLKDTIKQQCPDLFILLEADNSYLKKLKQIKIFLTDNQR